MVPNQSTSCGGGSTTPVSKEEELVLSPEFFIDIAERHGPARCEVLVKRNGHVTEMSAFRFDAVIRLGPRPGEPPTVIGLDWRRHQLDADRLAASVVDAAADVVIVSGIPDRLVNAPLEHVHCWARAGAWRRRRRRPTTSHSATSRAGRTRAHPAAVDRRRTGPPRCAVLPPGVEPPALRAEDGDPSAPRSNEPERGSLAATLIPRIRSELEQRLPEYMTPARFVVMPELPTLPERQDRPHGAPDPEPPPQRRVTPFVEPIDRLEELLVEVWRAVTGVDAVGTHDDFFGELGGHSLLAARLAARLRSVLDADVPLQLVFDAPTIVAMASALRGRADSPSTSMARPRSTQQATATAPPARRPRAGSRTCPRTDRLTARRARQRCDRPRHQPDELPLSFAQQRLWSSTGSLPATRSTSRRRRSGSTAPSIRGRSR